MERCSIMLGKTLHRMMPVPQLRKNWEGLKSWYLYFLSILFINHWNNWNPSIGLSKLCIISSFTPMALLWHFCLLSALALWHGWAFCSALAASTCCWSRRLCGAMRHRQLVCSYTTSASLCPWAWSWSMAQPKTLSLRNPRQRMTSSSAASSRYFLFWNYWRGWK